MKKIGIVLLVLFLLTGCDLTTRTLGSSNIAEYIQPPPAQQPRIAGTWRMTESQYLGEGEAPETETPADTSRYLLISQDFAAGFRQFTTNPSLKSKIVNTTNYVIQKLRRSPEDLGITEEDLEIVTVEGTEHFSLEILVVEPNRVMVAREGFLHTFERETEQLDASVYQKFMEEEDSEDVEELKPGVNTDTTLILARRSLVAGNVNVPEYSYETILLNMPVDEEEIGVYAANDIYVPRSSGFWVVGVDREEEEERIVDRLTAAPFVPGEGETPAGAIVLDDPVGRGLTFVNGTYLSMENTYYTDSLYSQYETYHFDTLQEKQPLDISLIAGERGKDAFISAAESEAQLMKNENGSRIVRPPETDEWGISRRNGRWLFRSIMRALDGNTTLRKGFDVNILPTTRVFSHIELAIPWQTIKEKHPSAIDALSSPNLDYIVIQERFHLFVYRLQNGVMEEQPAKRIRMRQNDRIVLAEWASGNVARDWLNIFLTAPQLEVESVE